MLSTVARVHIQLQHTIAYRVATNGKNNLCCIEMNSNGFTITIMAVYIFLPDAVIINTCAGLHIRIPVITHRAAVACSGNTANVTPGKTVAGCAG